jgi:phosphatidylserine/phosphatidylglycerophosphate/cardiolipin synthase-like enzyme
VIKLKLVILLVVAIAILGLYHLFKPLPKGLGFQGRERPLYDPRLLVDRTSVDQEGNKQLDQQIFAEVFHLIGQAQKLIVVDMFLFNDSGSNGDNYQPLARQLTDALIARKEALKNILIVVITDPFNSFYGGAHSPHLQQLRAAGIKVVETRLTALRDSNPLWSAPWRLCCQWLGNSAQMGWLPNPVGENKVSLRSYLSLLNFKANHRKTLVVDEGQGLRGLVTSANPHGGSSQHTNIGLSFGGGAAYDLLQTEIAVVAMSGDDANLLAALTAFQDNYQAGSPAGQLRGQIVTESRIRDAALDMVDGAPAGSELDLAMFYFSHRGLVEAFIRAHHRGVRLRVLLDANKDAFGREKNGIPNRQVALEFHRQGIPVRWCKTSGEQCHSKLLIRRDSDNHWQILLGSANFTRRNLNDFNLETNIRVWGQGTSALIREATDYVASSWPDGSTDAAVPSLPFDAYEDRSTLRYWRYRIMEATGLSTF